MIYIFCLLIFLFFIWTFLLLKGKLQKFDKSFYELIEINSGLTFVYKFITNLASFKFLILVCLLILFLLEDNTIAILFIVCLVFNSCLIGLVKNIIKRDRPNINRLVQEKGYSYPSGHTMCALSFYGFIIFLIVLSSIILPIKILLIVLLAILILQVGFSRIYLGVHYFSDVIGGLLLASSYLLAYIYIVHFVLNFI